MSLFDPNDPAAGKNAELIKHSAAIHIKTDLSLVDRKILNILLKNAYDSIDTAKYHTIRLAELKHLIGWNSKNYNSIKASLRRLVDTKIEWNIFKKDKKNEWVISALLASAGIVGGKCTYDYSYHLKKLLKNPNIYGKINLLTQNNFRSKYSLILWEYLTNYLALGEKGAIGTDWIKIKDYRDLMGIADDQYTTFKELSFNLIKSPIKEVNKFSNIDVNVAYQKVGKNIVAIRFIIGNKDQKPDEISDEVIINIKNQLLNFCKLSASLVDQILKDYSPEQLVANVKYIEEEHKKGKIKNLAAYSAKAIKDDFRLVDEPQIRTTLEITKPQITIDNNHPFWQEITAILKTEFGEEIFNKWLVKLNFINQEGDILNLATQGEKGKFHRDWIKKEYQQTMLSCLENKGIKALSITYLENDQ